MERKQSTTSGSGKDRKLSATGTLKKGDSGFFGSPAVTPSAGLTPQTPSRPDLMSLPAAAPQRSGGLVMNTPSPGSTVHHSLTEASMMKHYRHQLDLQEKRYLANKKIAEAKSAPVNNAPSSLSQQQPALEDDLLMAFECRQANQTAWNSCTHPYCAMTRMQWQHFKRCPHFQGASTQQCERCKNFQMKVLEHARACSNEECPVTLCADAKAQIQEFSATNSTSRPPLKRSQSFHEKYDLLTRRELARAGIPETNSISDRVQEILKKFESKTDEDDKIIEERYAIESKHSSEFTSLPQIPIANSITSKPGTTGGGEQQQQQGGVAPAYQQPSASQQPVLSPIAELPGKEEGVTPLSVSPPTLGYQLPRSPPGSDELGRKYPSQILLHQLNREYLAPNQDSFYFQRREYYLNDVSTLGQGGFGTCVSGQDYTTNAMFAMKRNNQSNEENIESICSECRVLARLKYHENVVRFFGAVLDEDNGDVYLPRVCKMIMELSENGNLAEMLVDEGNRPLPLPHDQALYYLEQVLQGVCFLHDSNVLHLDIKPHNVLVFDNGRTVKLADFGSAVHKDELTGLGISKGWSPHYAAPEVIRQEPPSFSADVWSVMCVLVHMVTGEMPGGVHGSAPGAMIFLVGNYKECDINKLVPLLDTFQLDTDVVELFYMVFKTDPRERPSAFGLLQDTRIKDACQYSKCFDDDFDEEYEDEYSQESAQEEVDVGRPAAVVEDLPYLPLVPLEPPPERATSDPPLPRQISSDSGTSSRAGRSSTSSSVFTPHFRNSYDSAMGGTPADHLPSSFNFEKPSTTGKVVGHSQSDPGAPSSSSSSSSKSRSSSLPYGVREFQSLPARLINDDLASKMERSLSFSGADSGSGSVPVQKRRRPSSIQPLTHSNSVPTLMDDLKQRRRLSLQTLPCDSGTDCECDGVQPSSLRRTSSEVYVDRGPDIDTPEEKRQALLEGLPIFTVQPPSLERAPQPPPPPSEGEASNSSADHSQSSSERSISFASARAVFAPPSRTSNSSSSSSSSSSSASSEGSSHSQRQFGGPNASHDISGAAKTGKSDHTGQLFQTLI